MLTGMDNYSPKPGLNLPMARSTGAIFMKFGRAPATMATEGFMRRDGPPGI